GSQGVMIPHSNVQNLMLRPDVADAVDEGQFHLWSVTSVDDAMEILSDTSMDEVRDEVASRLEELNEATRGMRGGEKANGE
ncbi:MAG: hypothetical protein ACOCYX_02600, partial [Spirochaetota bacterium]